MQFPCHRILLPTGRCVYITELVAAVERDLTVQQVQRYGDAIIVRLHVNGDKIFEEGR